jgi:hypothetical protein
MSTFDQVKSRPISQLPLIGSMIDGALNDTRDHLQTLTTDLLISGRYQGLCADTNS